MPRLSPIATARLRTSLPLLLLAACSRGPHAEDPTDASSAHTCETEARSLPIPFAYTLASDHLEVATPGGPLSVMVGPWGAHVQPHTGHPEGNVKADWYGLFTPTRTSSGLVEVGYGDGAITPGGCDVGARCGVLESDLFARRPAYAFPGDDVTVRRVELVAIHSSDPLDGLAWEVEVGLCPYGYVFGHVQGIPDALAERIVAAGGEDPRSAPMVGKDYVAGLDVVAPAGTPLAYPQIRSRVIDDNPLYRTGVDSVPDVPWVQIEWTAIHRGDSQDGVARPEYAYMAPDVIAALSGILDAQVASDAYRYVDVPRWLWAAEHVLVATEPFTRDVQTGLAEGLGGWFQRPESGLCEPRPYDTTACAETLAVFPIHTEGTYYDPADYSSPDVRYLVYRGRATADASRFVAFGELLDPVTPDATSGVLLVRFRYAFDAEYQRIAYRLDPQTGRARFRYGARVDANAVTDLGELPDVAVPGVDEPCTDDTLICMTAKAYGRF